MRINMLRRDFVYTTTAKQIPSQIMYGKNGMLACHMKYLRVHKVPCYHRRHALGCDRLGRNLAEVRLEIGGQSVRGFSSV
jgi:hypothetical protein